MRYLLIPALLLSLAACTGPTQTGEPERVPLGKADAIGSCDLGNNGNACGGPAAIGNCWCDDKCEEYGDCCGDKQQLCDADVDLCELFSGPCDSDADCGEGFACGIDPTTCAPSACGCDPDTGSIWCTKDCGGNECIPVEEDLCEDFVAPCSADSDCGDGSVCVFDDTTCNPSSCSCDPSTGFQLCTKDCGGGQCVAEEAPECEEELDCFELFGAPTIECVGAHWECSSDNTCQQTC